MFDTNQLTYYIAAVLVAYGVFACMNAIKLPNGTIVDKYDCYDSSSWTKDPSAKNRTPTPKLCPLYDQPFETFQGVQTTSPWPYVCCEHPYGDELLLNIEKADDLIDHLEKKWAVCYKAFPNTHPLLSVARCSNKSNLVLYQREIYFNFSGKKLFRSEVVKVGCWKGREYVSDTPCEFPYYNKVAANYTRYQCWLGYNTFVTEDSYCITVDPYFNIYEYLY
jgi:hypothetical protein